MRGRLPTPAAFRPSYGVHRSMNTDVLPRPRHGQLLGRVVVPAPRALSSSASSPPAPFDEHVDRGPHYAMKHCRYALANSAPPRADGHPNVIPMWVADTEFRSPPAVLARLRSYLDSHGVLGYSHPHEVAPLEVSIVRWLKEMHGWDVDPTWIVHLPGVVPGFHAALMGVKTPGRAEAALVQAPNYPPLLAAPGRCGFLDSRIGTVISNATGRRRWVLDFGDLERKAADPKASVLLLCNPTNPTGTSLTPSELAQVADICTRHDLIAVSDEIWSDLVLDGAKHTPAGSIPHLADRSITLMSPSKSFNIAGLGYAFAVVPSKPLRSKLKTAMRGIVPAPGILPCLAAAEAYSGSCDAWLEEQRGYLLGNAELLAAAAGGAGGLVEVVRPEATFLAWLDCTALARELGLSEGVQGFFEKAGLGPSPGMDFGGSGWKDWARINFGAPRGTVQAALARLGEAVRAATGDR
ncbi:aminotransferase, class I and II [Hyaloraphidium curvatum]|nr:aminotransferase, class I and II [Hyaloraphidium curvatum]